MFKKPTNVKRKWPVKGAKPANDNDADDLPVKKTKKKVLKKILKRKSSGAVKHSGTFNGKSNALGHGGRAAQLRARGVPSGVIGAIARS